MAARIRAILPAAPAAHRHSDIPAATCCGDFRISPLGKKSANAGGPFLIPGKRPKTVGQGAPAATIRRRLSERRAGRPCSGVLRPLLRPVSRHTGGRQLRPDRPLRSRGAGAGSRRGRGPLRRLASAEACGPPRRGPGPRRSQLVLLWPRPGPLPSGMKQAPTGEDFCVRSIRFPFRPRPPRPANDLPCCSSLGYGVRSPQLRPKGPAPAEKDWAAAGREQGSVVPLGRRGGSGGGI